MTDPDRAARITSAAEESFFDILGETLQSLDRGVRGQFLSRFFKAFASIDVSDRDSTVLWDRILSRHRELNGRVAGPEVDPVSLKAAMVDILQDLDLLHVPVVVEYRELRKLQVNAGTDALTGLYNRRLFEEYFDKEMSRARRSGAQLALMIADLHRFKEVNDRYGHPLGDEALKYVAAAARDTLRSSDFAFRVGGDEFAVLLPQCDGERCEALGGRLRNRYEILVQALHLAVPLTLDYGTAVFPSDGDGREALVRVADRRLYEMKNPGRDGHPLSPAQPAPARPATAQPAPAGANKRKWERILLAGTTAHVVWNETDPATAPVVDLSYGGVAVMVRDADAFPLECPAVLHVPTQAPVKVVLHKAYTQPAGVSGTRIGCAFVATT